MYKGGIKIFFLFVAIIMIVIISASLFSMDYAGENITRQAHDVAEDVIEKSGEKVVDKIAETGKEKIATTVKDVSDKILHEEYDTPGYLGVYDDALIPQYEKNVLFFTAQWCPHCQKLENMLAERKAFIPPHVSIMTVDFDDKEMRERYAVTQQRTFVLVDSAGTELRRWTNSDTLDDIIYNTH